MTSPVSPGRFIIQQFLFLLLTVFENKKVVGINCLKRPNFEAEKKPDIVTCVRKKKYRKSIWRK